MSRMVNKRWSRERVSTMKEKKKEKEFTCTSGLRRKGFNGGEIFKCSSGRPPPSDGEVSLGDRFEGPPYNS